MTRVLAIGECMVELADIGNGLFKQGFAGDTFNTAWYMRKLLPSSWQVAYFTTVGDDALSTEMLAFMEASGIATSHIQRIAGAAPGLYMITLKDGERSFSYWRDSSAAKQLMRDEKCLQGAMAEADIVYFSGITLAILSAEDGARLIGEASTAKARGAIVAFDTNYRARLWQGRTDARDMMRAAAGAATIVLPGLDDEQALFGRCDVTAVAKRYAVAEVIVVKDGANGATVFEGTRATHVPAISPKEVVDTTAAGDSFNAGFLSRLAMGDDAVTAATYAARIASQVVGARGALVDVSISSSD